MALAGFALDSGIEIFASVVVVWQLSGRAAPERERRAVRLIGLAFLVLAVYLAAQTAATLLAGVRPDPSPLGIGLLAATSVVMFGLAAGKARTGRALGNETLQTEAKVTVIDGSLAAAILVRPRAQRRVRLVVGRPGRGRGAHRVRCPGGHPGARDADADGAGTARDLAGRRVG